MPLPPLRTVGRDPAPAATPPPGRGVVLTPGPAAPSLDGARLAPEVRGFLTELVNAHLLAPAAVGDLLARLGSRLPQLTTRERAADALVAHGFLTRYQAERARAGLTHGLVLGSYRLLERISGGTVGIVFLGEHAVMRRRVAVKVLPADDAASAATLARFLAEVRLLAGFTHPHVVTAFDAGLLPGGGGQADLHYLILELVTGGDLEQHVYKAGAQPPAVAAEWGRQIASGLHAAHTAGLVHRDLKPSNILLTDNLQAKITDFGLAREPSSTTTGHGKLLGTLEFMAPEQLADAPTCGPAADVYGLGATLFWVLTGQLPLDTGRSTAEAIAAIRGGVARRLRQFDPKQPAELDALLHKMLARNPADRPTAVQVAQALAPLAAGSVLLAADGHPEPAAEADRLRAVVGQLELAVKGKAADADAVRAGLVAGLAAAAAARPGEPAGHQQRVTAYTRALGTALLTRPEWAMLTEPKYLDDLAAAAAAHDLGMVGVPDAAPEAHPRVGADVLFAVARACGPALPGLRLLRAVVRNHHERWDGTGYPDRLAETDIPPAARLVAVAVAYDDHRRTAPARTHLEALALIRADSGKAFDPQVVDAFLSCAGEFERTYAVIPDREGEPAPGAVPELAPTPTPLPTGGRLRWAGK